MGVQRPLTMPDGITKKVSRKHVKRVLEGILASMTTPLKNAMKFGDTPTAIVACAHAGRSALELLCAFEDEDATAADPTPLRIPRRRAARVCFACHTWGCDDEECWDSASSSGDEDSDDEDKDKDKKNKEKMTPRQRSERVVREWWQLPSR